MSKYSVVIPCYKSSKSIQTVVESTIEEFIRLQIEDYEFVLVNDCSPDDGATKKAIFCLAEKYDCVKAIDLGKNVGQHNATMCALNYATGDFVISMDDDLQTQPSEIKKLINKMNEGYDVVYGYYKEKKESLFRRIGSTINHLTVCFLLHKPKWLKTSSFWIVKKYVKDEMIRYTYPTVHLQGVILRSTDNISCVEVDHHERVYGKSTYSIKKLASLYSNILGFSIVPLRFLIYLGFAFALIGFLGGVYLIIRKIVNPSIMVGWTWIAVLLCFFFGLVLFGMGILGEYLGRLFRGNTKYPQYVIKEISE